MSESFTGVPAGITSYTAPIVGDVVLDKNSDAEYVCIAVTTTNDTTTYTWELLGRSGSWSLSDHEHGNITNDGLLDTASMAVVTDSSKKITTADLSVTDANASTNATTTFVQAVTQNAQGQITVTKASLDTSGTWSGTATKATTTENTSDSLYLVGVKSGATSTLLHDTGITIKGNNLTISSGTIYFGSSGANKAILGFSSTYPKYGIWYSDETNDIMAFSASGNGDSKTSADFAIKGGGTLWNKGSIIPNTGNNTGTVGSDSQPVYINAGTITAINKQKTANALINALDTGASALTADDYVITQYVGGGTTTTTYHRRKASNVVNGTLVKAALGTVTTTAKKFLKDTGSWVQVDWSDLTGKPDTFTPSAHEHDYIGKTGFIAYPSDGYKEYSGNSVQGYIKIKIPQTKSATMFSFDVDIYNYIESRTTRYHIAGYNYNNASWNACTAYCIAPITNAKANLTVRFLSNGNDEMYVCIGETDTSWSYPKIVIHNIVITHSNNTLAKWKSGWTITVDTTAFDTSLVKKTLTNTNIAYKTVAANLTTTTNAIAYYTDTAGTFGNSTATIDASGNITATSFIGSVSGNATTATSWANARKVYTDLTNASTDITINGGAADATAIGIGINGTLGIANGGTGVTTVDDIFATYGIEYIEGTQTGTKATNWTGNTNSTALYIGKTIAYKLPIAGDGSATLELTFPNGTTTGQKAVYAGNTRLTTHYPANSIMIMVWNGTEWRTNPYYNTDNDYRVRQAVSSTNGSYPLLFSSRTTADASNNTAYVAYRNNNVYINPSTGTIYATAFNGSLTGDVTGNADTATKLAASKTIWGQNFDGSANITGNMTDVGPNLKLPADASTDFYFLKSDSKAAAGYFGKLALNTTYANADLTNYVLDVLGAVRIKLPNSSTTSSRKFIITRGNDNQNLSISVSGIQAYNNTTTSNLCLQYYGGTLQVGTSDTATATRDMYGQFTFHSTSGFTYGGMGTGTTDIDRPIWFMAASNTTTLVTGRPVYSSSFKYNPSTNTLSIGTGTLTATNYSGTSATVTTTDDTTNTMYLVGVKSGATTTLLYDTNLTINNTTIAANNALYLKTTASNSLIFQRGDTYVGAFNTSSNLVLGIGDSATWNTVTSFKLYVNGKTLLNNSTASSTDGLSSQLIVRNNASSPGNVAIELVRGSQVNTTYTSWQIAVESGDLHLRSNYNADGSGLNTAYTYDAFSLVRNTGSATFKGSVTATTYYGALECRASTSNLARHVWFSYSTNGTTEDEGVLGKDDDFKYNPSTNVLTVGKLTITGGTTNSSIASSGTLTIGNATKALTVSTTTAALTISTTTGALEAKSTGSGTVKLTGTTGAMTISTTTGAITMQTNGASGGNLTIKTVNAGAISIESAKSSISLDAATTMSLSSTTSTSLTATTTMSITSTTSTSISATTTMSITGTQGTTITSGSGYATVFKINTTEYGRFNTSGMFQLNDTGTQNTHKLYVNGDSAFNGKIAIGAQASNAITENVYMAWNATDQSLDFIFP